MAFTPEEMAEIQNSVFDAFSEMLSTAEKDLYFYTRDDGSTPDAETVELVFRALRDSVEHRKRRLSPEPKGPPIALREMLYHETLCYEPTMSPERAERERARFEKLAADIQSRQ